VRFRARSEKRWLDRTKKVYSYAHSVNKFERKSERCCQESCLPVYQLL